MYLDKELSEFYSKEAMNLVTERNQTKDKKQIEELNKDIKKLGKIQTKLLENQNANNRYTRTTN